MPLSIAELENSEDNVVRLFPEKITGALTLANQRDELETLLKLLNMSELLMPQNRFESYKEGKIVVVDGSNVREEVLLSIAKNLGVDKKRFEFCLDYYDAQKYDFKKMRYQPSYRLIMIGPVPHSGYAKEDNSSIISGIKNTEGYLRVERLMSGTELKITKTSFREKLQEMIDIVYI